MSSGYRANAWLWRDRLKKCRRKKRAILVGRGSGFRCLGPTKSEGSRERASSWSGLKQPGTPSRGLSEVERPPSGGNPWPEDVVDQLVQWWPE